MRDPKIGQLGSAITPQSPEDGDHCRIRNARYFGEDQARGRGVCYRAGVQLLPKGHDDPDVRWRQED